MPSVTVAMHTQLNVPHHTSCHNEHGAKYTLRCLYRCIIPFYTLPFLHTIPSIRTQTLFDAHCDG